MEDSPGAVFPHGFHFPGIQMSDTPRPVSALLAVVLPVFAAGAATAQERLDLSGGFQPDPVQIAYSVTGSEPAGSWVRGCPGFLSADPAVAVSLSGANVPLQVYLVGEGAGGVMVADPDGIYHCEALDPYGIAQVKIGRVLSGEYLVWPMAAAAGSAATGSILISEADLGPRDVVSLTGISVDPALLPPLLSEVPLAPQAEPTFGRLALPAEGMAEAAVTLMGRVPGDEAGPGCNGLIDQTRPDVTVTLAAPEPQMAVSAASAVDTTLIVVAPDGTVACNDDAGSYDPAVVFGSAAAGDYAVWVGVYPGGEGQPATVRVSRDAPEGAAAAPVPFALDAAAEPAAGRHALPADGAVEVGLTLAAGASASEAGDGCGGQIDPSRPDATVTLSAPEAAVWFGAASDSADTTILVVGPDGAVRCNDDHDGVNAAVPVEGAAPGDYAVWVGAYPGQEGQAATLKVAREEPSGQGMTMGTGQAAMPGMGQMNPFAGMTIESAAQALNVLIETFGLGQLVSYDSIEETGPEGFVLRGVTLNDPSGATAPVRIGQIRIGDLDLAGLSAYGAPERFSVALEGIDYAALAAEAQSNGMSLPEITGPTALSVSMSLLPPDGDMTRREARFGLGLDNQISVSMAARVVWPEGVTAMGPMGVAVMAQGEAVEFEMHDLGFGAAMLDQMARESGQSREALITQTLDGLSADLGPIPPGSPEARFLETVTARFHDIDRPGKIRMRFRSAQPMDMAALMEAISAEHIDELQIEVELTYTPDQ